MNDLYIHQLETENKQLREQLQLCRNAINDIKEELNKTIDAKDKIIKEQVVEIAKWEKENTRIFDILDNTRIELYNKNARINKAIECIKNRNTTKSKKERFMSGETTLENLLEILGDKE